ncbi:glycosyltransferase family 9 protein [bacterium]|nr:glycosyltransferase family 9 protein [bacterium]
MKKDSFCPKNILVVRYGTIGDTIFASAFYRELRRFLPEAVIDVLADKITKGVMQDCPYINNFVEIDGKYKSFFKYIRLFKKYDAVFFLKNDSFFTQIAFFAGIKKRIGFKILRNKFLNFKVPYENKFEIDCYLDLLKLFNIPVISDKTEIWINKDAQKSVLSKIENNSKKKVVIQAYSRFAQKNWIDAHWVNTIKYLSDELDVQVFYAGGAKDSEMYKKLNDELGKVKNPPVDMSGKLSISETMALVNISDAVIGVDSGIIHMAAALDKPSILLHGPTSLVRWKPRSEKCVVLSKNFDCSPCCLEGNRKKKKLCKNIDSRCMTALTPDLVINQINNILQ